MEVTVKKRFRLDGGCGERERDRYAVLKSPSTAVPEVNTNVPADTLKEPILNIFILSGQGVGTVALELHRVLSTSSLRSNFMAQVVGFDCALIIPRLTLPQTNFAAF